MLESENKLTKTNEANSSWIKWGFSIVISLLIVFEATNVYNTRELNQFKLEVKDTYISKQESDKFRREITKRFSLSIQLVTAQNKQIQAKLIDKDEKKYQLAKEDECDILEEIVQLNYDVIRGGK
jgi:uncharacterized membrane-anchored protein YhcB (DUF1043 family)